MMNTKLSACNDFTAEEPLVGRVETILQRHHAVNVEQREA